MYVMLQPGDGGSGAPTVVAHPAGREGTWCGLSGEEMGAALPSQLCVAFGGQSSQKALWLMRRLTEVSSRAGAKGLPRVLLN